jgi:type II secretory pathway component PulF
MPTYVCKVVDNSGKSSEITKDAPNEEVLILDLVQRGFSPLKIKTLTKAERDASPGSEKKFSSKSILEFTETVSLLLSSGLSLKDALEVGRTIFTKGPVHRLTAILSERLQKGDSFHSALEKYPDSFPPLYRGLARIGEKIGSLENIFERLSAYLRDSKRLTDKLGSALLYPLLVLGFAITLLVGMVVFIFPRLTGIFAQLQQDVNDKIKNSLAMVNVFFIIGGVLLGLVAILVVAIIFIRRSTGPARDWLDNITLKIPVIGTIAYTRENLNFFFAMETLTSSGFSVEDALPEASMVYHNKALQQGVSILHEKILKGEHLSDAFLEDKRFEERIGRWVSIGERSGKIDKVFSQLKTYYQEELDKWSTRFMGVVEPVLIIGVGLVIIFMIMTFFVPIFSIYQNIR